MNTKYRTVRWDAAKIQVVEIERETDNSIWINGSRQSKGSSHCRFHDSWEEARDHLMKLAEGKVSSLRNELERARSELGNVKGLKEPK